MVRWWRVLGSWEKTGEERIGCSVQRYEMQVDHALVELWEKVGARGYVYAPRSVQEVLSRSRQLDRLSLNQVHVCTAITLLA